MRSHFPWIEPNKQRLAFTARFLIIISIIIALRFLTFLLVIFIFQGDPSNDSIIFEELSRKPLWDHISGEGPYTQFPAFSPLLFEILRISIPIDLWIRASFLAADILIFSIFYFLAPNFQGSKIELMYVLGVFTAPLVSVWAQDEILAVFPYMLMVSLNVSALTFILLSFFSFILLKNFYLFLPPALLHRTMPASQALLSILCVAFMVLLDRSSNFAPDNPFTASIWYFSAADPVRQKFLSLAIVAIAVLIGMALTFQADRWREKSIMILALFFLLFYHVNFEYFVFVTLPILFIFFEGRLGRATMNCAISWYLMALSSNTSYALGYTILNIEIFKKIHALSIVFGAFAGLATIALLIHEIRKG